jgi:hypothetical protein
MIDIRIPRREDDPATVDIERTHPAVLTAVRETLQTYPTVSNATPAKEFDRLFENLYNCSIEYYNDGIASRIVWQDERDYTVFLLRWA